MTRVYITHWQLGRFNQDFQIQSQGELDQKLKQQYNARLVQKWAPVAADADQLEWQRYIEFESEQQAVLFQLRY